MNCGLLSFFSFTQKAFQTRCQYIFFTGERFDKRCFSKWNFESDFKYIYIFLVYLIPDIDYGNSDDKSDINDNDIHGNKHYNYNGNYNDNQTTIKIITMTMTIIGDIGNDNKTITQQQQQ